MLSCSRIVQDEGVRDLAARPGSRRDRDRRRGRERRLVPAGVARDRRLVAQQQRHGLRERERAAAADADDGVAALRARLLHGRLDIGHERIRLHERKHDERLGRDRCEHALEQPGVRDALIAHDRDPAGAERLELRAEALDGAEAGDDARGRRERARAPSRRSPARKVELGGVAAEHALDVGLAETAQPHLQLLDRGVVERRVRAVEHALGPTRSTASRIFVCIGMPDVSR